MSTKGLILLGTREFFNELTRDPNGPKGLGAARTLIFQSTDMVAVVTDDYASDKALPKGVALAAAWNDGVNRVGFCANDELPSRLAANFVGALIESGKIDRWRNAHRHTGRLYRYGTNGKLEVLNVGTSYDMVVTDRDPGVVTIVATDEHNRQTIFVP